MHTQSTSISMVLWRKVGSMFASAALVAMLQIRGAMELVYQWLLPLLGKCTALFTLTSLLVQKWVSLSLVSVTVAVP